MPSVKSKRTITGIDKHIVLSETQELILYITSHVRELTFVLCKKKKTVVPHQQLGGWLTLLKPLSVQRLHRADSEGFSAGCFYG